jgi:hypothetical protein
MGKICPTCGAHIHHLGLNAHAKKHERERALKAGIKLDPIIYDKFGQGLTQKEWDKINEIVSAAREMREKEER